jgi:hypothetical protein
MGHLGWDSRSAANFRRCLEHFPQLWKGVSA